MLLFSVSSEIAVISMKRGPKGVQYHWKANKLLYWRKGATGGYLVRCVCLHDSYETSPYVLGILPRDVKV